MRYGIPAYRLPRVVLDAEIARIVDLGVRITCDHRVEDLATERSDGHFDAVFVAVGAHLSKRVDIPTQDASRIVDAVSFLRSVASGNAPIWGIASRCTAVATPRWTPHGWPAGWERTTR